MAFHCFQKNRNHHLGRGANAKSRNNPVENRFWWALGSVKTLFLLLFVFVKNVAVQCVFDQKKSKHSCFLEDFYTSVGFWKRWVVFQTHTKHLTSQNCTVYAAGTTLQTDRLEPKSCEYPENVWFSEISCMVSCFSENPVGSYLRALYKNINI